MQLPPPPGDPPPVHFPVIASIAPLVASGLIWAVTGSPFAMIFGALGPVIAVATMADGRRQNRRTTRRDSAAWHAARDAVVSAIGERHNVLREAAWARMPAASTILAGEADSARWHPGATALVALGTGVVESGILLEGSHSGLGAVVSPMNDEDAVLSTWAGRLKDGPVVADIGVGLGIVGRPALTHAAARAVLVQLTHARSPAEAAISGIPADGWEWMAALPHATGPPGASEKARAGTASAGTASAGTVSARTARTEIMVVERSGFASSSGGVPCQLIALSESADLLPPGCATVIRLFAGARAVVLRSPVHPAGLEFTPELVSEAQAANFATSLSAAAARAGLGSAAERIPDAVTLSACVRHGVGSPERSGETTLTLRCPIGVGELGVVDLDLVRNGPHAIVGGTTGSGKSEMLVTWVVSMASLYSPEQVTFLLVDFKGGAAFRPLARLPHCVGLITDLDERQAARALASLRAELRHRERVLSEADARDIEDARAAGMLPRLVIVVDEFQAMLDTFPELHALFVNLAGRGRSLGIHLILCTQRPAGVVRDSLLANCSLRVSLRVNNSADSSAVIGTDAAAAIAPSQPGRALVQMPGGVAPCQVATTTGDDIDAVAREEFEGPPPRRPWLDPLPRIVTTSMLRDGAYTASERASAGEGGWLLGLVDEPEHQRYGVARYDARAEGHLFVVGAAGSGKSALLHSLAAHEASRGGLLVSADVEATWDAIRAWSDDAERGAGQEPGEPAPPLRALLLDDVDSVFGRWDPEYQVAAAEALVGLLRDGQASGLRIVIAAQRLTGPLRQLFSLCSGKLVLRLPERDEYVAAGGADGLFDPDAPPGAGVWRGARIQLVFAEPPRAGASDVETALLEIGVGPLIVVSGTPARTATLLRGDVVDISASASLAAGAVALEFGSIPPGTVFIGDPDAWQRQWSLLAALRRSAPVLFDRCTVAEFRSISGRRQLPPPLAPGRNHAWLLDTDGRVTRTALPPAMPPSKIALCT